MGCENLAPRRKELGGECTFRGTRTADPRVCLRMAGEVNPQSCRGRQDLQIGFASSYDAVNSRRELTQEPAMKRFALLSAALAAFAMMLHHDSGGNAQDPSARSSGSTRRSTSSCRPDAKIEVLADGFDWSEGVCWIKDGGFLVFSDIPPNKIMKWDPKSGDQPVHGESRLHRQGAVRLADAGAGHQRPDARPAKGGSSAAATATA